MRVNRRFLYLGVFLVAIGGVLVAADLGLVDTPTLTSVLQLWPLAVIVVGLGLVLRRNPQLSLSAGMLAAVVPGLVLGGAFAAAPRFPGDCGSRNQPAVTASEHGTFVAPASVSVIGACGTITVNTAPGSAWLLNTGNTAGRTAVVRSSPQSLSVQSIGGDGSAFLKAGRDAWALTLPTIQIDDLSFVVNAGRGQVALPGARIGQLRFTANLSEILVDASAASISNLSGTVNLGFLSIHLPAEADLTGSLAVRGGLLQVCTPPGVGLRVTSTGSPREVTVNGLQQTGSEWQSPDYASAPHRTELLVHVTFGGVQINPIGGCR